MNSARLRIRRLRSDEVVEKFDCGDKDLNEFIIKEAPLYRKTLLAVSYILESMETEEILAYFSLANDRISLSDFENKTEFNRFRRQRFVNEKRIKSYPAVKICRLAVSLSARNLHLGSYMIDFIKAFFLIDLKTGCRFVTVDAYRSAIPFYQKNGFLPLLAEDNEGLTNLMYFDLADYQGRLTI